MTNDQIKQIVATGDFCIQCPADFYANEKWEEFVKQVNNRHIGDPYAGVYEGKFYSLSPFAGNCYMQSTPESKTVLTLDQWWDAVHGEDCKHEAVITNDFEHYKCAKCGYVPEKVADQPAQWQPQPGEICEFSDTPTFKVAIKRRFIGMFEGFYMSWSVDGKRILSEKYCRPIQQPITITPDQAIQAYAELNKVDAGRVKILES